MIKILPSVRNANVTMAENSKQNPIIIVFFSPQIFIAGRTKTPWTIAKHTPYMVREIPIIPGDQLNLSTVKKGQIAA